MIGVSIVIPVKTSEDPMLNDCITSLKELTVSEPIEIIVAEGGTIAQARNKGIQFAKGEIIVTMDSDGQHDPDDIFSLIKPILDREVDYTIGSRYLGNYYYKLPISTRFGEVLTEKLIQILFGIKIKNNQNGFRAYKREIIEKFNKKLFIDYAFCTEQILQAKLYGYRIRECPIKVYEREFGSSKVILPKITLNIFSCLLIYSMKRIIMLMHRNRRKII